MGGEEGGTHVSGAVGFGRALTRHLEHVVLLVEAVRRAEVQKAVHPDWKVGHPARGRGCGTAGDCDGADNKKAESLHCRKKTRKRKNERNFYLSVDSRIEQ